MHACCGNVSADAPFAELNYGALPNVQVSVSLPMELDVSGTGARYGYGATEFGIKTRFVQESSNRPQISFYPSIDIPSQTGERVQTFLPVWLQKSEGPWTAFGGGGLYLDSGAGSRDYTFTGGALERSISGATAVGAELYHQGAATANGSALTAADFGIVSQVGSYHAILASFGRAFGSGNTFSAYASYEFELGSVTSTEDRK